MVFEKRIDLITVGGIMQNNTMGSDLDFRETVLRERVILNDVA